MGDTYGLYERSGAVGVLAGPVPVEAGTRRRRGLRIALLSLAAVILVVGAGVAGAFGYAALARG